MALLTSRRKRGISTVSPIPERESEGFLDKIGVNKEKVEVTNTVVQNVTEETTTTAEPSLNTTWTSENLDSPQTTVSSKFDSGKFHTINDSLQDCKRLTQPELVAELKQKGTYNPELMAWDALGVIRFLDRTIHEHYQRQSAKSREKAEEVIEKNVEALANLMKELNVTCNVKTEDLRARLQNVTFADPKSLSDNSSLPRRKRMDVIETFLRALNVSSSDFSRARDQPLTVEDERVTPRQKLIGESHVVPFGCDKRGAEEDGYLRLCGACQAIRRLPDTFFPPFINEVTCDTDKACLYFYDYPHGKCRQKHMNFVVLRNVGTKDCQVWKKFNLNVRVSCECFVDEMSFFAKYV
ncbi:unnamed protein product [Caenorhabditis auriculariae]|uniref:Spaetzle domain-containing protein n=1 Tax=Caenorhabditis auriculariae TaxID=2777116 RepID=A0A8S1GTN4_9PELO|nr:unnamed protein product [Caenorhabditis auriculariae]